MTARDERLTGQRLKALAHPLRVQLLERLATYGPATASALAERLGESSGATSYHLRQLEKSGFVREDTTRGTGRERWWERTPGGLSIDLADLPVDSPDRAAAELVTNEWARAQRRLLDDFQSRGERVLPAEWLDASELSSINLQLTADQTAELGTELAAVAERFRERYRGQRGDDVRAVALQLNLFAVVDAEPRRDVGGAEKNS
jgi:DNA-binding transcriptional ArsR family regulator